MTALYAEQTYHIEFNTATTNFLSLFQLAGSCHFATLTHAQKLVYLDVEVKLCTFRLCVGD